MSAPSSSQMLPRLSSAPAVPRWAGVADGLTVLMLLMLIVLLASGPVRVRAGALELSVGSIHRVLLWLAIVIGVRHRFVPRPTVAEHVWSRLVAWSESDAVRAAASACVISRAAVLLVGYLAIVTIGYPAGAPPVRVSENEWLNLPMRWDAGWYLSIATSGYQWSAAAAEGGAQQSVAFFPAYPLLIRAIARLAGIRPSMGAMEALNVTYLVIGLFISLAAFGGALVYVFRLARDECGDEAAGSAVALLAAYPFAVFFSAVYTESLMLLASAGAFHHGRRGEWTKAAAWGLLAGLTRPHGFLLGAPLALMALGRLRHGTRSSEAIPAAAAAAAPALGLLLYSGFLLFWIGRPLAWTEAHAAWGRGYIGFSGLVLLPFTLAGGAAAVGRSYPIDLLNALAAAGALAAVWPVTKRIGAPYGVFIIVNVLPPLLFGGLLSMGRLTSVLFPLFMYLAAATPARARLPLACGLACVQGLAAALFFTWRPMI